MQIKQLEKTLKERFFDTKRGICRMKTIVIDGKQFYRNTQTEDILQFIEKEVIPTIIKEMLVREMNVEQIKIYEDNGYSQTWFKGFNRSCDIGRAHGKKILDKINICLKK